MSAMVPPSDRKRSGKTPFAIEDKNKAIFMTSTALVYLVLCAIGSLPPCLVIGYVWVALVFLDGSSPQTTREKGFFLMFAAFMYMYITIWLIVTTPQYLYLAYTGAFLVLVPFRWYTYFKEKKHYILIEWTYVTNALALLYLWLPISGEIRAALFPTVYTFMSGPLVMSATVFKKGLKLQCEDNMTCIFIHVYPSLAVWGIKWHMSPDDYHKFPLCLGPTTFGPDGCQHVTLSDVMTYVTIIYILYVTMHSFTLFVWRKKYLEQNRCVTCYTYYRSDGDPLIFNALHIFGSHFTKIAFYLFHATLTFSFTVVGYICFHSYTFYTVWTNPGCCRPAVDYC